MQITRDFAAKADPDYAPELRRLQEEVTRSPTPAQAFGVASASLPISSVAGKLVRYSGYIRTEAIARGYAGLWLRVDGRSGVLFLDNMSARGASGTQDWTRYQIEVRAPSDATGLVLGVLHPGDGTAWFDSLSVEVDGVAYTEGLDLDFESPVLRGFTAGGAGYRIQLDGGIARTGRQSLRSVFLNTPTIDPTIAIAQCAGIVDHFKSQRDAYRTKGLTTAEIEWAIQNARVTCQAVENTAYPLTRDRAMAENVEWILDQNPEAKIVLWAHNGHVAAGSYRGYVPMGSYLWEKYGTGMIIFGFAFNQGSFQAIDTAGTGLREFTAGPAPSGTLDAIYAGAGIPAFVIDMRKAPLTGTGSMMRESLSTRTIGSVYDAGNPAAYFSNLVAPDAFDAMIFIDRTTRARPLP
jgi:hypothetical protein